MESVYEEILYKELLNEGMIVERQKALPVFWRVQELNLSYRTDLIVENKGIIELTKLKLGLLINFNSPLIKTGITRIVNGL